MAAIEQETAAAHPSRGTSDLLDRYVPVEKIGPGRIGTVYRAVDTLTGDPVSVERFELAPGESLGPFLRLRHYAPLLSTLTHPHIARIVNVSIGDSSGYIVQELPEGRSLSELTKTEALSLERVIPLARRLTAAVTYAHDRDILHGSLRPDTIIVQPGGDIRITDFGMAFLLPGKILTGGPSFSEWSSMAPEQREGRSIDRRTDVFGLGLILYVMLTGRSPARVPRPPSELRPDVPTEWDAILLRALADRPGMRFGTPLALDRALASLPNAGRHDLPEMWVAALEERAPVPKESATRTQASVPFLDTLAISATAPELEVTPTAEVVDRVTAPPPFMEEPPLPVPAKPMQVEARVAVAPVAAPSEREAARPRWTKLLAAVAVIAGIVGVQILATGADQLDDVLAQIGLLGILLRLSIIDGHRSLRSFFLTCSIVPLTQLVILGIPQDHYERIFWYGFIAVPLLVATVQIALTLQLSPRAVGLRLPSPRWLLLELAVAVSGVALGFVEWSILKPNAVVPAAGALWVLSGILIFVICTGFVGELMFRGIVQTTATIFAGWPFGILAGAALFAAVHVAGRSAADVAFAFGIGIYFGLVVRFTRSLLGVSVAHGVMNAVLFIILPLSLQ